MKPGLFITLEGVEGVGKTTHLNLVCDLIRQHEQSLVVTREPGGTELAEQIRELVLQPRDETVDPLCELLLIFAARAQHVNQLILPALQKGDWVVSDRFTDATFAYQGYGRGLDMEAISTLEQMVQKGLQPDLTLYLDCSPEIGLARAGQRDSLDRIEDQDVEFFNAVRDGYLKRASEQPERFLIIDASQSMAAVAESVSDQFGHWLDQNV